MGIEEIAYYLGKISTWCMHHHNGIMTDSTAIVYGQLLLNHGILSHEQTNKLPSGLIPEGCRPFREYGSDIILAADMISGWANLQTKWHFWVSAMFYSKGSGQSFVSLSSIKKNHPQVHSQLRSPTARICRQTIWSFLSGPCKTMFQLALCNHDAGLTTSAKRGWSRPTQTSDVSIWWRETGDESGRYIAGGVVEKQYMISVRHQLYLLTS